MSAYLKLIDLAKGPMKFVHGWNASALKGHEAEQKWIAALRLMGVKLAHPDDGWVDRRHNEISPCYPQFNDGPQVGDLIALGQWHQHRLVRVIKIKEWGIIEKHLTYSFEDAWLRP